MTDTPQARSGELGTTLATWMFILESSGHPPASSEIQGGITALKDAGDDDDIEALGRALEGVVVDALGDSAVGAWLAEQYGAEHIGGSFGDERDARARAIRTAQFRTGLPWLAQIIERTSAGEVAPHWMMIEHFGEQVTCMDPDPWDDHDEEVVMLAGDFMVKWELAGTTCAYFKR